MHPDLGPDFLPVALVSFLGGGDHINSLGGFVIEVILDSSVGLANAHTSTEDAAVVHFSNRYLLMWLELEQVT